MISREQVEGVLIRVRPLLERDEGGIELIDVAGNCATVRLSGNCAGCPSAALTLYFGIESALKQAIPGFDQLLVV